MNGDMGERIIWFSFYYRTCVRTCVRACVGGCGPAHAQVLDIAVMHNQHKMNILFILDNATKLCLILKLLFKSTYSDTYW